MTTTKSAIKIDTLKVDTDFAADAARLGKAGDKVQMDVHRHLYAIAFRWSETGDIRPAVARVNTLIAAMPKGFRVNAIRQWVEAMFGFEYVEKQGEVPAGFKAGKIKADALPMDDILHKRWYEFTAEAPYKPLNFGAELAKLLKRAGERATSAKGDDVDPKLLDAVKRAISTYQEENVPH